MIKILLKSTPALVLSAALVVLGGCKKDEFTEEDVLKLMQETDYTVFVQEPYTKAGVAGAKVTLVKEGKTVTQETDAQGVAHFTALKVGKTYLSVKKDQHISLEKEIDIRANAREGQHGSHVGLYYLGNDANVTAEIKGRVRIQTDLTTAAPEVPVGLVVKAVLVESPYDPLDQNDSYDNGLYYPYDEYNEGYYNAVEIAATVDAQGEFSIKVPVGLEGRHVRLKFPTVVYNQKLEEEVNSGGSSTATTVATVTRQASFDPYRSAVMVPDAGTNTTTESPSGFTWPNNQPFQRYSGQTLYYMGSNQGYWGHGYYLKRGTVLDLDLNYGTGTVRN